MCACEHDFVCARCQGVRYQEPVWPDWREEEAERFNDSLSRVDFESPFKDAA